MDDPHVMTDEEAVAAALKLPALFGHIVERYEAPLARYVSRLGVRNKEDREDLLQDIFIKVYRNLNQFDTSLSFSSWIYRIAHNEAVSWYRKRSVRPEGHLVDETEGVFELLPTALPDSEVLFDRQISADELWRAIDTLDEKYRTPLILRFFEHKEYEEISDILKIPVGSVGTLIHRGKKLLKEQIDVKSIAV